ncbi:TonB-dependent receptor [Catenovulum agarivorans DS-2]|uniref:TonB-dependent receptor n=1 Tax=Catenovulum agarivorans DS-2 TaxID=1328313 RepID=W7QJN2_9ALTE|nr:TonB-dependent receptor [Catenovulum agarivorans]EWH08348.1 TonB-dependent receptor [Catenovulum agarivorans DS-2]
MLLSLKNAISTHLNRPCLVAASQLLFACAFIPCPTFANSKIETIEVVSQHKKENLQSTPLSVSALGKLQLERNELHSLTDIETHVPGLSLGSINLIQPQIYIRGIGSNDDSAAGDSSVAVFVDQVYLNRMSSVYVNSFDLQSIEVLRGPQGTLYGKNGVGGVIHFIRNKPSLQDELKVRVGAGNFGQKNLDFVINKQLTEQVATRVSFGKKQRDGYVNNPAANAMFSNEAQTSMHAQLALYLGANHINLAVEHTEVEQNAIGHTVTGGGLGQVISLTQPKVFNSFYQTLSADEGRANNQISGMQVTWQHQQDNFELQSISAFKRSNSDLLEPLTGADIEYSDFFAATILIDEEAEQLSQEFRLLSPQSTESKFNWLAGVYWMDSQARRQEYYGFDLGSMMLSTPDRPVPAGTVVSTASNNIQDSDNLTYAAYFNLDYAFNSIHTLSIGYRLGYEQKKVEQMADQVDGLIIHQAYQTDSQRSFNADTLQLMLANRWLPNVYTYMRYAQGYKSGGFQGVAPTKADAEKGFAPEYADNYEIGVKSDWWRNQLRLNAAVFYTDYQNLQVLLQRQSQAPVSPISVENAAAASSKGIELEWVLAPKILPNWNLSGHLALLNARYEDFKGNTQVNGNKLRNAPKTSYALNLSYYPNWFSKYQLEWHASYRYKGTTYQEPENLSASSIPGYHLLSSKFRFKPTSDNWLIDLWVENLTDEKYYIHKFASPTSTGTLAVISTPARPRNWGVKLTYQW